MQECTSQDFIAGQNVAEFEAMSALWRERGCTLSTWRVDDDESIYLVVENKSGGFSHAARITQPDYIKPVMALLERDWAAFKTRRTH